MRKIILLSLCSFFVLVGFSQNTEKAALDAAFLMRTAAEVDGSMFRIPGEYIQKEGKIVGQRFKMLNYAIGNIVTNEGSFLLVNSGDRYSARLVYDACTSAPVDVDVYDAQYDSEGKINKLEGKFFSNVAKQLFVKYFFTISYKGDKIIKITKGEHLYEGKTSAMAKLQLSYDIQIILFDWSDDEKSVVISSSSFYRKKKENEKQILTNSIKTKYEFEENGIKKQELDVATNNVKTTESIHYSINETKREFETSTGSLTEIYTTKEGKILKVEQKQFNADRSWKSHTETLKQFETINTGGMTDACNYNVKDTSSIFNDQGKAIEERSGGKFRKKGEDGTWGEWQVFRL